MGKRVVYYDIARGISILLVIVCHTLPAYPASHYFNSWIFSFHMPLFFIISGCFFKDCDMKTCVLKKAKHLLVPYFIIEGLKLILHCLKNGCGIDFNSFFGILYGNGSPMRREQCWIDVPVIEMTWFLPALFICQIIYLILYKFSEQCRVSMWVLVGLFALIGISLNNKVWLPFSIQPALSGLFYYHVGYWMKTERIMEDDHRLSAGMWMLGLSVWGVSVIYGRVRMNANLYETVGDFFAGIIGTYVIIKICKKISDTCFMSKYLRWCGEYSMVILGIHTLEQRGLYNIEKTILELIVPVNSLPGIVVFCILRISIVLFAAFVLIYVKKRFNHYSITERSIGEK